MIPYSQLMTRIYRETVMLISHLIKIKSETLFCYLTLIRTSVDQLFVEITSVSIFSCEGGKRTEKF